MREEVGDLLFLYYNYDVALTGLSYDYSCS